MDLTLTDDQQLIQSTAREFLASAKNSSHLWKEMVELGWTGLPFPEEYGGVGAGFLELCLVIEELGHARVASPFLATMACCGMPILRHGSAPERAEWLPAIAGGRVLSYVRGVRAQEGALHGTAMFVPYADAADTLLVIAHGQRTTAVLVDPTSAGITQERVAVVSDPSSRVSFDHVPIEDGAVLEAGTEVADAMNWYGTAATCAEMVGGAQAVLEMTVDYATQREQFGKPIGTFQAVQHHCANMAVDILGARFIAYEAIWRLASGLDATTELSLAKSWVSEVYEHVCATAHQVHGAIGFTAEHGLSHYTRHATASALTFGDADHHISKIVEYLGMNER